MTLTHGSHTMDHISFNTNVVVIRLEPPNDAHLQVFNHLSGTTHTLSALVRTWAQCVQMPVFWTVFYFYFLHRLQQQQRSLMSGVSCQRNPCRAWRYRNTSNWWSSWERGPTGKSCWRCIRREVGGHSLHCTLLSFSESESQSERGLLPLSVNRITD